MSHLESLSHGHTSASDSKRLGLPTLRTSSHNFLPLSFSIQHPANISLHQSFLSRHKFGIIRKMAPRKKQIKNATVSMAPCSTMDVRDTYTFRVLKFKDIDSTKNHYVETPVVSSNGHNWTLHIYPGGDKDMDEGCMSIYLMHRSEKAITITYELMIVGQSGKAMKMKHYPHTARLFSGMNSRCGGYAMKYSDILDKSKKVLSKNGTLIVVLSITKKQPAIFVPKNDPTKTLQRMIRDKKTADVCFQVNSSVEGEGEQKKAKVSEEVYAHRCVLKTFAPEFAIIYLSGSDDSDENISTVTITDVKPDIFRHMISYVYGVSVPQNLLKKHAKDFIKAADKYSIVILKLEAEEAYVKSTKITMDNAVDNLRYAEAMSCALLKEKAMEFFVVSAENVKNMGLLPEHLLKEVIAAIRGNNRRGADELANARGKH